MIELDEIGNIIEVNLFDVYTDRYFVSQFQLLEEHREVEHENNT